MKKSLIKATGVLCAAAVTASMAFTSFGVGPGETPSGIESEEAGSAVLNYNLFTGTVISVEDGRLHMNRQGDGFTEEIIVNIGEDTKVLDAVNGYPIPLSNLEAGEAIHVYVGPAMTMSLPAIVNGIVVLADIPADAGFPVYAEIADCVNNGDGTYTLKTVDGKTFAVNGDTTLLPYLTRNMVYPENLTEGVEILLWTSAADQNAAAKIVIFPGENGYGSEMAVTDDLKEHGWSESAEGWQYFDQGELTTGWLEDNGSWYYINPETGYMMTGFVTVDGKTYFLQEDGKMLTEARVFTPDESGALH